MTTSEFIDKISRSASSYPDVVYSTPCKIYTCVNPYSYHIVKKQPELYDAMDGLFVDGMTMCWWIKWLWRKKIPRLSFDMSSMAADLFKRLNENDIGQSIYFIGAKQPEIEGTINQIKKAFPKINISGYRNGYFTDETERNRCIEDIVECNPSYVIIGLGSPRQEKFAIDLKNAGYKGICFTCGGFLHQTSDKINYYPEWVNKFNLRAFYRLVNEKGMFGRLWHVLITFPVLFTIDSIKSKF